MYTLVTSVSFAVFGLLFLWYWRQTQSRRSIAHLPGPPPYSSWLVGNAPWIDRPEEAVDAQVQWTRRYGDAFCIKGCFGENVLYISDPKGLQYILNIGGYNFPKTRERRIRIALITGRGLSAVDGARHSRQKKVMSPSFSQLALKEHLPLFLELSRRTAAAWMEKIYEQNSETAILNVSALLSRTTLDVIGEAAFNYKFDSIGTTEPKTELHKAYRNLFVATNYMVSDFDIMFRRLMGYAPFWVSNLLKSLPKKDLRRLNAQMRTVRSIAKGLVEKQMQAHASGEEGGKDVMSILIRANNSEDPRRRLNENEILSQITTLVVAGSETSANTLSWTLYELSRHPHVQLKLREEVRAIRAEILSRGELEITISDLDRMKYLLAVIKESLRYHTIVPQLFRQAIRDDVIPLETPQRTVAGDEITAVPIRKGQVILLGLASYNRLKKVWGEDADLWKPERFLQESPDEKKATLGMIGNISTFSSGARSCIGWRFAMLEMQAVLMELIEKFEFSPAPNVEIKRKFSGVLLSMVKGQEHKGSQMPLTVSVVSNHMD